MSATMTCNAPLNHVTPPDESRLNAYPILMIAVYCLISQDATRLERDEAHISSLADDFRRRLKEKPNEHPIQTPLRVVRRGDKYLIVAGNNRFFASLRIPLHELPCIVLSDDLDEAGLILEAAQDNQFHQQYTRIELARLICLVAEKRNCSHAKAGKLLGIKSASEVTKLLRVLTDYPPDLWPLIGEGNGKVPFTTAYALARLKDIPLIRSLTEAVTKSELTRDAAEEKVASILTGKKPKEKPLTLRQDGISLTVKKPAPESLRAFIEKLSNALKKLKPTDNITDLAFHFRAI